MAGKISCHMHVEFFKTETDQEKCRALAHWLYYVIPNIFPWEMNETYYQQCKRKPDEPVLDIFEHFEKLLNNTQACFQIV